ncbi:DUF4403 family protein [Spirosoma aerolatum]|uniref:DUF4403 family protein n=1 Tax=Spirosoma aerolatum TaxID=1211326 RepID=UPI001FE446F3|nr:DUF4403 family protein [Spirosoma aerolatum]
MTKSPSLLHGCFGLVMVLLLSHCQTKKAQPPQAEGFDPPIPETMSYIAGPIIFQLSELQEKINRELDPVLIGKQTKEGKVKGFISFRVKRLGPVQVQYANQKVSLSAPLQMWLTKPFSKDTTPPKKPFCALHVNFQTPIQVTSNWRLNSQTKFTDYTWIKEPELRLLGKEISLAKVAQDILDKHRADIETMIDSAIHRDLRLDNMVKPIWRDLQKPLLINRDYGLWLVPIPVSVAAGPVTGDARQLTTHIRMAFRTKTELKPSPPEHPKTELPRLQKRDTVSQVSDLHLMSFIPYADINRIMKLTISKQPKKMAFGSVTVKGVSVYGSQQSLIVKVDMDGLVDGPVYLRGRPEFDTLTNTLNVNNLDFDAQTNNLLARSTKPVWHKPLQLILKQLLTIRLGDDIAQFPHKISEAFEEGGAGKKTDLNIHSFRFIPQKIAIRPDGIQALIKVESQVALKINQL